MIVSYLDDLIHVILLQLSDDVEENATNFALDHRLRLLVPNRPLLRLVC